MPIKYIGRQRTLEGFQESPIAQLVNVPNLQLCQRCQYCHYWEADRNYNDVLACIEKHKCGYESTLWARLTNNYIGAEIQSKHFTPTTIVRQRKLSEVPRYLQYFTCDLDNYICNRLCQFYPKRVESEQSILECANSNGCGMNGSFLRLLEMFRQDISYLPNFFISGTTTGYIMQYNGQLISSNVGGSWKWNKDNLFVHVDTNGMEHRILSMYLNSPTAGHFLYKHDDIPELYLFDYIAVAYQRVLPTDYVLINFLDDLMYKLREQGIPVESIDRVYKDLIKKSTEDQQECWFTSNDSNIEFFAANKYYLVEFVPINIDIQVYVKIGREGNYYLVSPFRNAPPIKWRRVKYKESPRPYGIFIQLLAISDPFTQWLISIGVRESLFYELF